MLCNNKHCWRCQRVHKKDVEMAKQGYHPFDMREMGRVYIKLGAITGTITASGGSGASK